VKQLSSLIFLAPLVAACGGDAVSNGPDAGSSDVSTELDAGDVDAAAPVGPDLSCLAQPALPPPTVAVNPMMLGGRLIAFTTTGPQPVDAADIALFRAGQAVVLARTQSAANGAFSTGAVTTNAKPVLAYVKAMKDDYRTAFFYPPRPFTTSTATLIVPTMSNVEFAKVKTQLGATQNDAKNGALLITVADCDGERLAGATVSVRRGMSSVGKIYDLGALAPVNAGLYLVFDVPDGKVTVSATYQGMQLPEHEVVVRAADQDCDPPVATLTSTIVKPAQLP
jgi:hypothetical protein